MSLTLLTYLVVGFTFVLYIVLVIVRRVIDKRLYVADGGVHPVANGMATAADRCPRRPSYRWPPNCTVI